MRAYVLSNPDLLLPNEEREYVLKVRDLPNDEKPREKLLAYGPGILSASELLAVVLQMGTKREGVLAMTARILKEYGDSGIVHQTNPKTLAAELDIPVVKACQIVACFALGWRFLRRNTTVLPSFARRSVCMTTSKICATCRKNSCAASI